VAFALFQHVRRTVQRTVDRRFDRARYDARRTVDAFAERLRDEVDLDTLAAELERTVAGTVRPTAASLWLPGRPT
jgi:predicted unusual protein kinase regulating ubiquinone biosynthesis (AarF/ABC1/UbiB family)